MCCESVLAIELTFFLRGLLDGYIRHLGLEPALNKEKCNICGRPNSCQHPSKSMSSRALSSFVHPSFCAVHQVYSNSGSRCAPTSSWRAASMESPAAGPPPGSPQTRLAEFAAERPPQPTASMQPLAQAGYARATPSEERMQQSPRDDATDKSVLESAAIQNQVCLSWLCPKTYRVCP